MTDISKLYEMASGYLCGSDEHSCYEIVNTACLVLKKYPQLNDLWERCLYIDNGWLDDFVDSAYDIIEDISSSLGEYLDC